MIAGRAQDDLSLAFKNIKRYVKTSQKRNDINADNLSQLLNCLSEAVQGKQEDWKEAVSEIRRFGRASASFMKSYVDDFNDKSNQRLEKCIGLEIASGNLTVNDNNFLSNIKSLTVNLD